LFVYTKNPDVIERLEKDGAQLLQTKQDGTKVFALSPTSNYWFFENKSETIISDRLTF